MTPAQFAQVLVARLASILPPGFEARAEDGVIHLDAPDGVGSSSTSLAYLDPDEAEAQDYADAAWNVLSMAQDVVSETTTDPWPVALGTGLDLAEPGTRVEGQAVQMYFGPEDRPVLTLPPIHLDR